MRTSKYWLVVAVAAATATLAAACAPAPPTNSGPDLWPPSDNEPTEPAGDDTVRLNELQFIGTHNSYKLAIDPPILQWLRFGAAAFPDIASALGDPLQLNYAHDPLPVQLALGVRSFELDIFADPQGGAFSRPLLNRALNLGLPRPQGLDQPGMKVLHVQDIDYRSSCPTLISCLEQMRDFSDAQPDHLPVIVNIEMKDAPLPAPFDATSITPFDADQLAAVDDEVRSVLGDRLITPDDVRGDAVDLRTAITTTGWPTVAESRGRFLFFMDNANLRDIYLEGAPTLEGRVMFTSSGEGQPDGAVLKENSPGDGARLRQLVEDGYLLRTRSDADILNPSVERRDIALASGAQIVSTDFPPGRSLSGSTYQVTFGTRVAARCNPVLTDSTSCGPAVAVERR